MIWIPIQEAPSLSEIQRLQLEIIRRSSFNSFDGEIVVKDLLKHRDLWIAALMTRDSTGITLRDLPETSNIDTLYLTTNKLAGLKKLAKTWSADTCEEVKDPAAFLGSFPASFKVLQLWWD